MDILRRWLRDDLRIPAVEEAEFEKVFANGYYFGMLLSRYGLQADFREFKNKDAPDAKMHNFNRLQPVLRRLHIKFDAHNAKQLITEERGAAVKLLQQIKVTLDSASHVANLGTSRQTSRGSTSIFLNTNRLSSKGQFRAMEEQTFRDNLKLKSADPKEFRMQNHLKPFEDEAVRQAQDAERGFALEEMEKEMWLADYRDLLRTKMAENRAYLQDWERQGRINHSKNLATSKERERRELRFLMSQQEKERRAREEESADAARTVVNDIGLFETQHVDMNNFAPEPIDDDLLGKTSKETVNQFLQSLSSKAPLRVQQLAEGEAYLAQVKTRKEEDSVARSERDRRRRRTLVEVLKEEKVMNSNRRSEMLQQKSYRRSVQEERYAGHLSMSLDDKESIRNERFRRQGQYMDQRSQRLSEQRTKDSAAYHLKRRDYVLKLALEEQKFVEREEMRETARHNASFDFCRGIIDQVIDMCDMVAGFKEVSKDAIPAKLWRDWFNVLNAGEAFPEFESNAVVPQLPVEPENFSAVVDQGEYEAFVNREQEWKEPEPVVPASAEGEEGEAAEGEEAEPAAPVEKPPPLPTGNEALGAMLLDLRLKTIPPDPWPVKPDEIPTPEHRICLMGAPYAGSTTQAKKLAKQYNLEVIRVEDELIQAVAEWVEVMTLYDKEKLAALEETMAHPELIISVTEPELSSRSHLGGKAKNALDSGQPCPDDVLVDLFVLRIKNLGQGKGWVADNFPQNANQAGLLEKALAGIEHHHVFPPRNVSSSLLAPEPEYTPPVPALLPSGVSIYLRLHLDKEISKRRAHGRYTDPESETSVVYHVEFHPPPQDDPAMGARLEGVQDEDGEDQLLLERVSSYLEERQEMNKWFSRFTNMREVWATESEDEVFWDIQQAIANVKEEQEAKANELAEKAKAEAEAKQAEEAPPAAKEPELQEASGEGADDEAGEEPPAEESSEEQAIKAPFVPLDVHPDLATILKEQWAECDRNFKTKLKESLRNIREQEREILNYLSECRKEYENFLQRPDEKQKNIYDFQKKFNALDTETRELEEVKNELHSRADDLQAELIEITNASLGEAEEERTTMIEDTVVTDHLLLLAQHASLVLQSESFRFVTTQGIIKDYFCYRAQKEISKDEVETVNVVELFAGEGGAEPAELEYPEEGGPPLKDEDKELLNTLNGLCKKVVDSLCTIPAEDPEVAEGEEPEGDFAIPDMVPALRLEQQLLEKRCNLLVTRVRNIFEEIRTKEAGVHKLMEDLFTARFRNEMEAINGLIYKIKLAIENKSRLENQLRLLVADFVEDEDCRTYPAAVQPAPLPPREELRLFRLSTYQLQKLVAALKYSAPSGLITCGDLLTQLQQARAMDGISVIPAEWIGISPSRIRELVTAYDPTNTGLVDWRRLVYSLAEIPPVKNTEVLSRLVQKINDRHLKISEVPVAELPAFRFWFEPTELPALQVGANGEKVAKERDARQLKKIILDAFTYDGFVALDYLVLYACADKTEMDGMYRAAKVLSPAFQPDDMPPLGHVTHLIMRKFVSMASLSGFNPANKEKDNVAVGLAMIEATGAQEEGVPVKLADILKGTQGKLLLDRCFGLRRLDAYALIEELAARPPSAVPFPIEPPPAPEE